MEPEVRYLLSLQAVRQQSNVVYEAAKNGNLTNFVYYEASMEAVADYVSEVIKVCLPQKQLFSRE